MWYYQTYIGDLSINEFLDPYDYNIDVAIADLMLTWVWDEDIPHDFYQVLHNYLDYGINDPDLGDVIVTPNEIITNSGVIVYKDLNEYV